MTRLPDPWRKTTQHLAPVRVAPTSPGSYDVYPVHPLGAPVGAGVEALAGRLAGAGTVVLDGYQGVFWDDLRARLTPHFERRGLRVAWANVEEALRPPEAVDALVEPFLGGDDPLFGTRFTGGLADFFDGERLHALRPDPDAGLNVLYGCGAALAGWEGLLAYVDLPKNELQFRARAGRVLNLGAGAPIAPKPSYKRSYFVDWIALNRHKEEILGRVDLFVDGQRPETPVFASGEAVRAGLDRMSRTCFRVRPWFEPGPWGGQWIKEKIPGMPQDVPNYAWSFELIVPENGLAFTDGEYMLEVSFDWLMYRAHEAVLGEAAARFGYDFPIRFDFLDTIGGGNLSLQCHPRPDYIRRHFGEPFTQDETYYILDAEPGAEVYLGFREDVDPDAFRAALERSAEEAVPVDVDRFVERHPAARHDLFLIPSGTVHCSGEGNMVLEISATPYIFTFKMYDWMRLDLDGRPRPLNIDRAFDNLRFDRRGARVREELIARPVVADEGEGWRLVHLPTHPEHFYDVVRWEFDEAVEIRTEGACHVMSLVEGTSVRLETDEGPAQRFNYAETFVVPAAAGGYRLVNEGDAPAKVIQAFVKPEAAR